jgi:hypothetical protein
MGYNTASMSREEFEEFLKNTEFKATKDSPAYKKGYFWNPSGWEVTGPKFASLEEWLSTLEKSWEEDYWGEHKQGMFGDPTMDPKEKVYSIEELEQLKENEGISNGKGNGKGTKGKNEPYDDSDEVGVFKHGGRIKKKKRKKKGRPRGVGKALRGYGKAMKHGK